MYILLIWMVSSMNTLIPIQPSVEGSNVVDSLAKCRSAEEYVIKHAREDVHANVITKCMKVRQ